MQFALDLSPSRLARRRDPSTSHAAAQTVKQFAATYCALIVLALKDRGAMTVSEIARATKLAEQQVNKRLPEVERIGALRVLVVDGVELTRPGASGRMQRVWRAT